MAMAENNSVFLINNGREKLSQTICLNTDPSEHIQELIMLDVPLPTKFREVNFCDILARNSESTDSLKKLIMGLNILEKYGRHLLKPSESRSSMWRHIKYNNSIYNNRVHNLQGGREIMKLMGYSESRFDGVAFPDDAEPDHDKVLGLVVDIILGKKELETYLNGNHPHPHFIENFISNDVVSKLRPTEKPPETAQGTSNMEALQVLEFQPLPALSVIETSMPPTIPAQMHEHEINRGMEQQNPDKPQNIPEKTEEPEAEKAPEKEPKTPSIACDICGDNRADVICRQCDSKQLCRGCDIKWHKHPKRQNHKVDLLRPSEDATLNHQEPAVTSHDTSTISHDQTEMMPASHQMFTPQKTWQHQQGYISPEQQPGRQLYRQSQNFPPEFPAGPMTYHAMDPQQQKHYYMQRSPYSIQQYGQLISGEGISQKEGMTLMYDPVSGQHYEIPSLQQRHGFDPQSLTQPHSQNPRLTIHDQPIGDNRHQQFLLQRQQQQHPPAGHVITSSQQNFPPQRYMPGGTLYQPLSSTGLPVNSMSMIPGGNVPMNMYRHQTNPALQLNQEGGANVGQAHNQFAPPTPSSMSTPSPGTPIVSPISCQSDERNFISSGSSMKSVMSTHSDRNSSHNTLAAYSTLGSKLLPKIKAIPDLEKRRSRLEIDLMNLKEDVSEWDKKINEIIFNYPNFFQNEEYVTLNNKKRKHLHEIKELENYQKEVEEAIAEIEEEKKVSELENYRKLAMQKVQEVRKQDQGPPGSPRPHPALMTSDPIEQTGPPKGFPDQTVTYANQTGIESFDKQQLGTSQSVEDLPGLKLSSLENSESESSELPEDIRRMLVLDQSPFDKQIKPQQQQPPLPLNVPVDTNRNSEGVSYPPAMNAVNDLNNDLSTVVPLQNVPTPANKPPPGHMTSGQSAPDLQHIQHPGLPVRSRSMSSGHQWVCEHCTFINDSSVKVCNMCFKTSDNPRLVPSASNEKQIDKKTDGDTVHCADCTYLNKKGYVKCEMCGKEAQSGGAVKELNSQEPKQTNAAVSAVKNTPAKGLDAIIKNDQDQVYREKKAAQEQFEKLNKNENYSPCSSGHSTLVDNDPGSSVTTLTSKLTTPEKVGSVMSKGSSGTSEGTGSYETAKFSLNTTQDEAEQMAQQRPDPVGAGAVHKGFKGASDFTKTIEQIQLKRDQEQMTLDGHDLMTFVKEAENSDFDMEEIGIALQYCRQDEMKPIDWLKDKWMSMIKVVEDASTEKGKAMAINTVGDISREEAKHALLHCKGNVENAVNKCVADRQSKYKAITDCGQYANEDILTALLQNDGDLDEALDQLNQSVIQAYLDRLWGGHNDRHGLEGQAKLYESQMRADLNNAVCNSVVNHEGFLNIIKDMKMDRDRRIRMIFVEGKLVSWGRADLVMSLMEQNVLQTSEPLDCTLEDIIDAVRNCRDRKSSLVYLKQECGTCMGLYPMSKIRNLGVCNCKLCESCLKQCFEIAVREKFVRNWGCPICDAPGLGIDDTQATDYFDFLHLLLERLVSKDVMDLYDTKLRDWHLQKDPNFRWCAHCAFGFIWDRPDVLGMACPSCGKKTCFSCKIKWEDQHQGLTCEGFAQWKIDNDPEKQAKGVKLYLEENGIDCPSCKMRYSLAKGGCMHFKCPQCGHEFCSGCSQAFLQQGVCKLLNSCRNKGLHCHHPRDCFYYLRDNDVGELQKLLKKHQVLYNTEIPPNQEDKQHCPVMEQKEFGAQKKDEACGKDIQKGHAGLCEMHYKEYLVGLINKDKIDPVTILKLKDLQILIERNEKVVPELKQNEAEGQYRNRLIQFIKERFQLHR